MTVPKMSQLRPGIGVNIILKADQRSGRLTGGSISEVDFAYSGSLYDLEIMLQEQRASNSLSSCLIARFFASKKSLLTPKSS